MGVNEDFREGLESHYRSENERTELRRNPDSGRQAKPLHEAVEAQMDGSDD